MNNVDFLFKKCDFFEREVWGGRVFNEFNEFNEFNALSLYSLYSLDSLLPLNSLLSTIW